MGQSESTLIEYLWETGKKGSVVCYRVGQQTGVSHPREGGASLWVSVRNPSGLIPLTSPARVAGRL